MSDARAELKGLPLAERLKLLPRLLASLLTSQLVAGAMDVVQLPSRRSWLSLATKSANNQLKGAPWLELQHRLGRLPLELHEMIRDSFFNQEFGPGRIEIPTESPSGTPPHEQKAVRKTP